MEKNTAWKKSKGQQDHLPYDIKAAGKNIKLERGEPGGNFGEYFFIKGGG